MDFRYVTFELHDYSPVAWPPNYVNLSMLQYSKSVTYRVLSVCQM